MYFHGVGTTLAVVHSHLYKRERKITPGTCRLRPNLLLKHLLGLKSGRCRGHVMSKISGHSFLPVFVPSTILYSEEFHRASVIVEYVAMYEFQSTNACVSALHHSHWYKRFPCTQVKVHAVCLAMAHAQGHSRLLAAFLACHDRCSPPTPAWIFAMWSNGVSHTAFQYGA